MTDWADMLAEHPRSVYAISCPDEVFSAGVRMMLVEYPKDSINPGVKMFDLVCQSYGRQLGSTRLEAMDRVTFGVPRNLVDCQTLSGVVSG